MEKKLMLHTECVIDSAHYLEKYDGKCKQIHGHSWFVEIWIRGSVDQRNEVGILFDFSNISKIKEKFDHKLINDVIHINPTAENLAILIYNDLHLIEKYLEYKVRVYETYVGKKTYCEYGDF